MKTPRFSLFLLVIVLLVLAVSCAAVPAQAQDAPQNSASSQSAVQPAQVSPTLQSVAATATPAPQKTRGTKAPKGTPGAKKTPGAKGTPGAQGSQGSQGSQDPQAFPTSSYDPVTSAFNLILGRPTTNSIAASLFAKSDLQITLAYGTAPGVYSTQTNPINLKAAVPQTIELSNLTADTEYYYTILTNGAPSTEHSFHTARPAGNSFTFTIDADPHNRDPRFSGELYATTLGNVLADQPDFHINLGDTFMTEKVQARSYAVAESTFTDMRPYFGLLGADVPLFLVNGNHEGELGWLFTSAQDKDLPVWSTQLRELYYPNPVPNSFYTGASSKDAALGASRDGYYAWKWGDAQFIVLDPFWYTAPKPSPSDYNNNWNWTLGKEQYDWLKTTLETSNSKYKFVFIHNLVGGINTDGRGGIEAVPNFEWGGKNADGSYGFDAQRPGWGVPIHQLFVQNHVNAVFHGHDHVFVKQELDGIVYQECPQPSNTQPDNTNLAAEAGYVAGDIIPGSGHLRLKVTSAQVTVEFVRAYLPGQQNGQVVYSYTIK